MRYKKLLLFGLTLIALCVLWLFLRSRGTPAQRPEPSSIPAGARVSADLAIELVRLQEREREAAATVWSKEILAQECGRVFEELWDAINESTNKLETAGAFAAGEFVIGRFSIPENLGHGIVLQRPSGTDRTFTKNEWQNFIQNYERSGWQLAQIELRHIAFDTTPDGKPLRSRFYFSAHLDNPAQVERAVLEGELAVEWGPKSSRHKHTVARIDATQVTVKTRKGAPPFELVLLEEVEPLENSQSIDPLIVYDLDKDGFSEIVLAANNLVYRRQRDGSYLAGELCSHSPGLISTALIADFDRDGAPDFLCQRYEALMLFSGSPKGTFEQKERVVWPSPPDMRYPMALTCGDIDADGDLDLYVAQYKVPYENGSMPTPYFNANDGNPAYLLLNDGRGNFSDATEAAGLVTKRHRRSYSSSFADIDGDSDLDLIVVSDFAGVDLYTNDGHGKFTDVTQEWLTDPYAFGMAHALADFNTDGLIDFLVMGMTSATVDRLEHVGLWRSEPLEERAMRSKMTVGNRLYLANPNGGFDQTPLSLSIARSGWSWGCTAFDVDNDGFQDVYVANGLESRQSVRDYEAEYWLHDRFVGNSHEDNLVYLYFGRKFERTRGRGHSYGGYEKNRFFLNQAGESFMEAAYLLGVGLEQDSRNVVSDDLDRDGRVDLVVTNFEAWPEDKQRLRIYMNRLPNAGNWIGFAFKEAKGKASPTGARVRIGYAGKSAVREVVNGDSYRSQHAARLHFGLGDVGVVDFAEIEWPTGPSTRLEKPAINGYHSIP